jgi:hypothetical protein
VGRGRRSAAAPAADNVRMGWRYGALHPSPEVVAAIAAETGTVRGTPGFVSPVLDDPCTVRLVHQVLRAAGEGNALAAGTLLTPVGTRGHERKNVQDLR